MWGHEDLRDAVRQLLSERLPVELAKVRAYRQVATPPDPVGVRLSDTLQIMTAYPVVLVQTPNMTDLLDLGDGYYRLTYQARIVCAAEVPVASAHEEASRQRDRLSEAVRRVLLLPSGSLPAEVTIDTSSITESHGPAGETLVGRPLAVSQTSFKVMVFERLEGIGDGDPLITDGDLMVTGHTALEAI